MKNATLKILSIAFLSLTLFSCGGNGNKKEETTSGSAASITMDASTWSAQVLYPDGTPVKAGDTNVQWCNMDTGVCMMPVAVGEGGIATNTKITSGNYVVHLNGQPDGYAFNPNIYTVSDDSKTVTITMETIAQPSSGTGVRADKYQITTGTYECAPASKGAEVYYAFTPSESGQYTITSYVDMFLDSATMDPVFSYYGNNAATDFQAGEADNEVYNMNFSYTINVTDANIGKTYKFGVRNAGSDNDPFWFNVSRTGDYVDPSTLPNTEVLPEVSLSVYADSERAFSFVDLATAEAVLGDDGYYHLGSKDGEVICVALNSACPYVDTPLADIPNEYGNAFVFNTLKLDYTTFVQRYAAVCNSDGVYPVTEEMKELLQLFQEKQGYFVTNGWVISQLEEEGKTCREGNEWLFACGVYGVRRGTQEDAPIVITSEGLSQISIAENSNLYYEYTASADVNLCIKSSIKNLVLVCNDTEYDAYTPTDPVTLPVNEGETIHFYLKTSDGAAVTDKYVNIYTSEVNPATALSEGNNVITVTSDMLSDGLKCKFAAASSGNYSVSSETSLNVIFSEEESYTLGSEGTKAYKDLAVNESMTFRVTFPEGTAEGDSVTITITREGDAGQSHGK